MTTTLTPPPPPPSPSPPPASSGPAAPSPSPRIGRAVLIVVGGLLTAVAIGWGTVSLIGLMAHEEETTAVQFPASVRHLVVRSDGGSLTVRGTSAATISGERHESRGLFHATVSEEISGDTLTLRTDCPAVFDQWCSTSYDLDVPAGISIDGSSNGGGFDVTGVDGDLTLSSSAGSVHVRDASGTLVLHSSAGGIDATEVSSRSVRATSSAGEVSLSFSAAPDEVKASSSAGGVDIEVPSQSPAYRVSAQSSAGPTTVDVRTDPTSSRTIDASSSAGAVRVHLAAS